MESIPGGVTAAKGFTAAGLHCGIRRNTEKKDLALIYASVPCTAAAVYTTNRVKAAPLLVSMRHLENGTARAVVCNSGNANACAPGGEENAIRSCKAVAAALGIEPGDVIPASTGVIGQPLPVEAIENAAPALVAALSENGGDAAEAIMTTDLTQKVYAVRFTVGGKTAHIGGIAKGSGMIHPNMGTMLSFVTTDAAISADALRAALKESARVTYNRISVDGDTSTNDMNCVLASGLAGNAEIATPNPSNPNPDYDAFLAALNAVNGYLAREIARDGEGATKLVTCRVTGAKNEAAAEGLAKSVIASSLVKTAMFGADANWGRVLCAMGYSGQDFNPEGVDIAFSSAAGGIEVCQNGAGLPFDEAKAKTILSEREIVIVCRLREGGGSCEAFGCDLSYDYVKINGDYRT